MIERVLRGCLGWRFRVYSSDGEKVEKAFDEVLIEVGAVGAEHVRLIKEGPYGIRQCNRITSGHTLRLNELEVTYQSDSLVVMMWRGHTRFCFTSNSNKK